MSCTTRLSWRRISTIVLFCCFIAPWLSKADGISSLTEVMLDVVVDNASYYAFQSLVRAYSAQSSVQFEYSQQYISTIITGMQAELYSFGILYGNLSSSATAYSPALAILPLFLNGIVPIYSLTGLGSYVQPLVLSSDVVLNMYTANITNWSDPQIVALNPSADLPNQGIHMVFESGANAKNLLIKQALATTSPTLFTTSGLALTTALDFPFSEYHSYQLTQRTFDAQASVIAAADGSFGLGYSGVALALSCNTASMINTAGSTVTFGSSTLTYSASELGSGVSMTSKSTVSSLFGGKGSLAWPWVFWSSVIIDTVNSISTCEARESIIQFLLWIYSSSVAQTLLESSGYAPVPSFLLNDLQIVSYLQTQVLCRGSPAMPVAVTETRVLAVPSQLSFLSTLLTSIYQNQDPAVEWTTSITSDIINIERLVNAEVDVALFNPAVIDPALLVQLQDDQFILMSAFAFAWSPIYNPLMTLTLSFEEASTSLPLLLDEDVYWQIHYGCITHWNDPQIAALNPWLPDQLAGYIYTINLVRACASNSDGAPGLDFFSSEAALYQQLAPTSLGGQCIANNSAIIGSTCVSTGRILYAQSQDQVAAYTSGTYGAVGSTPWNNAPSLYFPSMTFKQRLDNSTTQYTPNLYSITACLNDTFDIATLHYNPLLSSNPQCWPWTQQYLVAVRNTYTSDATVTDASACVRGLSALQFVQWMTTDTSIVNVVNTLGYVQMATTSNDTSNLYVQALDMALCDTNTILITLPVVWTINDAIQGFGYVAACIGLVYVLALMSFVIIYRHHPVVRSASPLFVLISLLGVFVLFAAAIALVSDVSAASCNALSLLINFGLAICFCPVFMKTYRIYKIFDKKKLSVVKINNRRLLSMVGSMLLVELIIMAMWTGMSPLQPYLHSVMSGTQEYDYTQCGAEGIGTTFFALVCVEKGIMFLWGALMAFSTRRVNSQFNESSQIALCIYNVVLILGLIAPIIVVIEATGDTLIILLLFALLWIASVSASLLVVPKILHIMSHNETNQQNASIMHATEHGSTFTFLSLEMLESLTMVQGYQAALCRHMEEVEVKLLSFRAPQGKNPMASGFVHSSRATRSSSNENKVIQDPSVVQTTFQDSPSKPVFTSTKDDRRQEL